MGGLAVVITGPTASGKTDVGVRVARELDGEIISADSRQLYRHLDIGTAKPSPAELQAVPHHFISILEPSEEYNVSRFEREAMRVMEEISARGRLPVIVGGAGLYIKAVVDGIFDNVDTDEEYRAKLRKIRLNEGNEALYRLLEQNDPETAKSMLPQNWKRVMRALEVYHLTGCSIREHQQKHERETDFDLRQFGLNLERSRLYKTIERRVDTMLENGLLDEIRRVLELGVPPKANALNTVGYKELIAYLNGDTDFEEAVRLIKRNTRRYAKRQMTWFRRDDRIRWFSFYGRDELPRIADSIIAELRQQ